MAQGLVSRQDYEKRLVSLLAMVVSTTYVVQDYWINGFTGESEMEFDYRQLSLPVQAGFYNSCQTFSTCDAVALRRAILGLPKMDISEAFTFRTGTLDARKQYHSDSLQNPPSPFSCLRAMADVGYCGVEVGGYDSNADPSPAALVEAAKHKVLRWVTFSTGGLEEIRDALAKGYVPILTLNKWYGWIGGDGVIGPPTPNSPVGIGHAMAVVAYSDSKRLVTCKNMEGPGWGDGGFCHFTFDCWNLDAKGQRPIGAICAVADLSENGVLVQPQVQPTKTGNAMIKDQALAAWTALDPAHVTLDQRATLIALAQQLTVEVVVAPPPPPLPPPASPSAFASNSSAGHPPENAYDGTQINYWSAMGYPVPQWNERHFGVKRLVSGVIVYSLQDNWQTPLDAPGDMTFTKWGVQDFTVSGDGVSIANVSGNTRVKCVVMFTAPLNIERLRITVTKGAPANGVAYIGEIVPIFA